MKNISGLYTLTDTTLTGLDGALETTKELIAGGAKLVQLRGKDEGSDELLKLAKGIRELTKESGVCFIVNDRVDIALLSGADGVHLGQSDLPVKAARNLLGKDAVIGLSTHNEAEAISAAAEETDYISLGPIFPTTTKPDADTPKGLAEISKVASALERGGIKIPIVAIGGITIDTAPEVISAGASAVAVISDILGASDISGRTSAIIKTLEEK